jgi:uncharacterized protein (TIGR02996 family)
MRDDFERAILDRPDDPFTYGVYADWLQEQGDPRGEFMAVQLALEDEAKSKEERDALRKREAELLAAHEREWLGELAPLFLDSVTVPHRYDEGLDEIPKPEYQWRRGFVSSVTAHLLTTSLAHALGTAPAAQFVREFRVNDTLIHYYGETVGQPPFRVPTPQGVQEHWELLELIGSTFLQNLRFLQVGWEVPDEDGWCDCHTYADGLEHVIANMSRVEELYLYCKGYNVERLFALPNLANLKVLLIYHLGERGNRAGGAGYEYPLDVLARNQALGNLTHLLFHPHHEESYLQPPPSFLPLDQIRHVIHSVHLKSLTHLQLRLSDMGDDGVREIVSSGVLKRLKWLDLRHGRITDEGARLFAGCGDARNLERLDLSRNAVTSAGLNAVREAGVNAVANNPLTEQELADQQYLREGDTE